MGEHLVIELGQERPLCLQRRIGLAHPGCEIARELAGEPWPALRATPDHHRIGAGRSKRHNSILVRANVAIDDDGDRDHVLDGPHCAPVGMSVIELTARATVHRDQAYACLLGPACEFRGVDRTLVPAQPHLEGDGDADRGDRRLDQPQGMVEITHQRGSGLPTGDVPRRASHVDVDNLGARVDRDARALGHPVRFASCELNDMNADTVGLRPPSHILPPSHQSSACGHLGHHQAGAEQRGHAPKRAVRHARHGSQEDPITDANPAHFQTHPGGSSLGMGKTAQRMQLPRF